MIPEPLLHRQLIVVTGKGGVGKSVVTAALARGLARRGRRALALEIDPRENLHQLFDAPPSGGEVIEVGPRLYLQNLKPTAVVDWVVDQKVPIGLVRKRVKASPIYQRFAEGAPGLQEMAVIGHALRLVRGDDDSAPAIDTVVLDAPATGHGIYLLTAPKLFAEAIGTGPFADLARQGADFVDDPEACSLVIVTLAEEMPVQEALELRDGLTERFGRGPALLVVNGLYPPLPDDLPDDDLHALWRRRRQVNARELARLDDRWDGPRIDLPLLPIDDGPALVETLDAQLDHPDGPEDSP
ncbi:MAG: ArsA-related P-loop ATPase [Acidobacteriota bacterium]